VGSEVAQLYVSVPETENFKDGYRSPKNLKQFAKVKDLKPGEERTITMTINSRAFSFWDIKNTKWQVEKGDYGILIGASSRDIRLQDSMTVTGN
jgi:beta-glucosidase